MHMTGGEQLNSPYGLSILEPFVGLQLDREIHQLSLEIAEAWAHGPVPEEARARAQENVPLARRRLEDIARQVTQTLGGTAHLRAEPPADLYFPGHELMAPAAAAWRWRTGPTAAPQTGTRVDGTCPARRRRRPGGRPSRLPDLAPARAAGRYLGRAGSCGCPARRARLAAACGRLLARRTAAVILMLAPAAQAVPRERTHRAPAGRQEEPPGRAAAPQPAQAPPAEVTRTASGMRVTDKRSAAVRAAAAGPAKPAGTAGGQAPAPPARPGTAACPAAARRGRAVVHRTRDPHPRGAPHSAAGGAGHRPGAVRLAPGRLPPGPPGQAGLPGKPG